MSDESPNPFIHKKGEFVFAYWSPAGSKTAAIGQVEFKKGGITIARIDRTVSKSEHYEDMSAIVSVIAKWTGAHVANTK